MPFREVIEDESIDYCRIDLCIVGGITETLKITHWAEAHYIDIVPHNPSDPSQPPPAYPSAWHPPTSASKRCLADPAPSPLTYSPSKSNGKTATPGAPTPPAWASTSTSKVAEQRLSDPRGWSPHLRRPDGAFTNN